jgi:hypothetical protein
MLFGALTCPDSGSLTRESLSVCVYLGCRIGTSYSSTLPVAGTRAGGHEVAKICACLGFSSHVQLPPLGVVRLLS